MVIRMLLKKRKLAFTLVEIMIALFLMSIIMGAAYRVFFSEVKFSPEI